MTVAGARMLGSEERISFTQDEGGLRLSVPGDAPSSGVCAYAIELGE